MLEKLKAKRDALADDLVSVKNEDLTPLYEKRFEDYRQKAINEVNAEHEAKVNEIQEKIGHYDFVIEALEADESKEEENVVVGLGA